MELIDHILVALLLIGMPLISVTGTKKLKQGETAFGKESTYLKIFATYGLITIGFVLFSNIGPVIAVHSPLHFNPIWWILFYIAIAYILITQILPITAMFFSSKFREMVGASFQNRSFIFPTTIRQKRLFVIVPITVGITEEILFRGYLYEYFIAQPYGLSAIVSFAICLLIFSLGHFQQGVSGMVDSLVLGLVLGFLYFITGNLWLSILLHIIYDFKVLAIPYILDKKNLVNNTQK